MAYTLHDIGQVHLQVYLRVCMYITIATTDPFASATCFYVYGQKEGYEFLVCCNILLCPSGFPLKLLTHLHNDLCTFLTMQVIFLLTYDRSSSGYITSSRLYR